MSYFCQTNTRPLEAVARKPILARTSSVPRAGSKGGAVGRPSL